MKNADYWRGRFSILEDSAHREADQALQDIEEMYLEAQRSVQKEIESWYGRFAANNQISLADARKWLTTGQLEEFKWNVDQYIKAGELAGVDAAWLKKLENASAKVHISRLEAVQTEIQQQIELLYGNQVDEIDSLLKRVAGNGYAYTGYEVQKGLGLGWDMTALDQNKLETLISKPWTTDGRTFRDRCWVNKAELVNTVNTQMVQGMLRGDSPEKTIQAIQKQFGVSRYKARRLVHTETSYFNACSTLQSYKDLDIEQIEIIETLDSRTCEICGGLDGKVIPISQYEPGVTVPPFHPNCRGTTAPYYDDMDGERAARNAEGEVYYVPANMKFTDWKKAFMDGGSKSGLVAYSLLQNLPKNDNIPSMDITKDWIQSDDAPGAVRELQEYAVDGVTYKVDGHHVIFSPSEHELSVANLLSQKYGKQVDLLPQVAFPQGIQVPDYLINGDRFDLKSPTGQGKNLLSSMVSKKKKQAPNFIFDVSACPLSDDEIENQVIGLFKSTHTRFIEKIVVLKDGEVVMVYKRK